MKFGVLGAGRMGQAIYSALSSENRDVCLIRRGELPKFSLDWLICAVKPKDFQSIAELPFVQNTPFFLSVMAQISTKTLQKNLPGAKCFRCMPNIGVKWGCGMTYFAQSYDLELYWDQIQSLFAPLGTLKQISEEKMQAITALMGSGPAFILKLIDIVQKQAHSWQISSPDIATDLFENVLEIQKKSQLSPKELIEQIAPPGGVTQAGLEAADRQQLKTAFLSCFQAAYDTSDENN